MKRQTRRLVPLPVYAYMRTWREQRQLNQFEQISCDTTTLSRHTDPDQLRSAFLSSDIDREWSEVEREVSSLGIGNEGGINHGDRRAIYYLLRRLCPKAVLEVGTHVGASTVNVLAALRSCSSRAQVDSRKMITVDIRDVNNAESRPWKKFGSKYSPREMSEKMGMSNLIQFVVSPSTRYLSTCTERFDFIFLDGNHAATTVYQEVPLALGLLNEGGVILLHDYFPDLKPLWSYRNVIPGPWLATQRLKFEGADFNVVPFGELPWTTKFNSRVSSLALLAK